MANLRSFLGGVILLLSIGAAAPACENDSQSIEAERQIQEDYRPQQPVPAEPGASGLVLAGMGAGTVLLLGSLTWSVWRKMSAIG